MNILFLSEIFYPHGSGAELATFLYAKLLSQAGIDVTVITNRFEGEPVYSKSGSLTIHRLPLFKRTDALKYSILLRFDLLFSNFLKKMIKLADVVYIPRFWFSAIPIAKFQKKPVIVHLHDYIPVCSLSTLFNEKENSLCDYRGTVCSPRCIYSHEKVHGRNLKQTLTSVILNLSVGNYAPKLVNMADAVVCVSKKQMEIIGNKSEILRGKMSVIYNPFPPFPDSDISGDDFGYFGGSEILKGYQILQAALNNRNKPFAKPLRVHCTKFAIMNENTAKALNEIGMELHGKLDRTAFEQMYKRIKCVIVPSIWHEPWPYVVVEALLRGRFVVASHIGGIPEQTENSKGVLTFKAGDSKTLAATLESVANLSREQTINLGHQNREVFLKRFNTDSSITSFINLCNNICSVAS